MVQLSGLFERVQAEGAAGVRLLVGVPLHLIDRFSADALELTAAKVTDIFFFLTRNKKANYLRFSYFFVSFFAKTSTIDTTVCFEVRYCL